MDTELQKYEQLANPEPAGPVKSKAPSISKSLADLSQRLHAAREQLLNQPDASPQAIQHLFQNIFANVESSKTQIDDRLKESHASSTKIAKLIEKKTSMALPEYPPMFRNPQATAALQKTIAQHFVRTGSLETAHIFSEEAGLTISQKDYARFAELQTVIEALRRQDIGPALAWVEANRGFLESRDSNLEFLLHRSQYIRIVIDPKSYVHLSPISPPLAYLQSNLLRLQHKHSEEFPRLNAVMLWQGSLERVASSPYPEFSSPTIHDCLENAFIKEYCARSQVSNQAPLKIVANIGGGVALPRIEKGRKIMKERKAEWSHTDEIPVEIPLPPENYYHTIFTCPVSKEQATEGNPPMMLSCGHVIVQESLHKLTKAGIRVKCPYCPRESTRTDASQLYF